MTVISVVIPAINESDNIYELLDRTLANTTKLSDCELEIIFVDDDSEDGTREEIRKWMSDSRIKIIHRRENKGLASAIIDGAKGARGNIIVVMDADLSHPPESIPDLVKPILAGGKDMVIGSRYISGGTTPGWPLSRAIGSKLTTLLARVMTDIRDPLSGFFAVRKKILLEHGRNVQGFKIGLALLVRGGSSLRTEEVPIEFRNRKNGQSKMSLAMILAYARQIVSLAGGNISRKTGVRFGLVGILGLIIDVGVFHILFRAGVGLGPANTVSFFVACLSNFLLNKYWAFPDSKDYQGNKLQKFLLFVSIALLALFLRGGVLALLIRSWHWPVYLALTAAIGTAAAINYLGSAFVVFPCDENRLTPEIRWRVLGAGVIGYTVLLRLVYLGMPELLQEEAYYWNYGQHLALGYLDHPPLLAWLIRGSVELFGTNEWAVRLAAFISWLITAFFGYQITLSFFDRSTAFRALCLLAVLPAFFCTGFLSTPDAPLIACWSATLFFLYKALIDEQRTAWYGVGICLGLGMLSKYTIVLLVPAVFVFILISPRSMRWLGRPQPYIAAFLALLLFSPVILWNADNNWASFVFQGPRRIKGSFDFSLFELLGHLVLLLTPAGLLSVVKFMPGKDRIKIRAWFKNAIDQKTLFVLIFTFIPFAVFLFFSLFRQVKLSWTVPVWLAFLPVMARTMTEINPIQKGKIFPFLKRSWQWTILGSPLILSAILYYSVLGFPGLPYFFKDSAFLLGWKSLAENIEQVKNRQEEIHSNPLIVGLDKYRIASGLAFYRKKAALKKKESVSPGEAVETASRNLFGKNSLMYMFWYPSEQYAGRDMILVSDDPHDLMRKRVTQSFKSMEAIKKVSITKNNKPVRSYYYRLGYDFRPKYVCGPGKNTVTILNKQLSCQVTSLDPIIFTAE